VPPLASLARTRLTAVTAVTSTALVVTAAAGYALLGAGPAAPARASAVVRTSPVRTALPLRVPEVAVTMTARPTARSTPASGSTTAAPRATPRKRMPSAAERDRELAAVAARSGTSTGAGTGAAGVPATGATVAADAAGAAGTGTGTDAGTGAGTAPAASTRSTDFVLSSFNVLGASHTRHGGRGRAPGVVRIRGAAELLARHDVDVAGFQELQHEQARALQAATGGGYALYPGAGARDSDNSIGWRTSRFGLVRATTLSVPYFDGHHRQMPVVLLRDRASGLQAWFGNFHNPAETSRYHHQQRWRTEATYLEAALARRTAATGVPLFVTGDMNERADFFCRFTAAAPGMVAARGGSNGPGGCLAGRPRAVDWVLGSRGVVFSGYDEDRSHLVDITTDHPVVSTRVHLDSATFPSSLGG